MTKLAAVVLAAGQGKRMRSALPKVLHTLAGRALVHYPVAAAEALGASPIIVVVGHGAERVGGYIDGAFGGKVQLALQAEQLGTGHAVMQALPMIGAGVDHVLILCGDSPLLRLEDLMALSAVPGDQPNVLVAMLACEIDKPSGYGRILRDERGAVTGVCEDRDLTSHQKAIREVNAGAYCVRATFLSSALSQLKANNAQGEVYLTDIVQIAARSGGVVAVMGDPENLAGINDRAQLAAAENILYERIADRFRVAGASIQRGARIDDAAGVDRDAVVMAGAVIRGASRIGEGALIDTGAVIINSQIAGGATIKPYSVVDNSTVAEGAQIGPFAHLRPESQIGPNAHIGNFVETKKTIVRTGAKANHLAYLGDGDIGEGANIGAGTIFCNYDGFQKHLTVIGKGAFIGSDSQLVAPVTVGDGAYVGTGSTVTHDVPADALAIGRARQVNKDGYALLLRARLAAAKAASQKK